jgi:hypothetical protein
MPTIRSIEHCITLLKKGDSYTFFEKSHNTSSTKSSATKRSAENDSPSAALKRKGAPRNRRAVSHEGDSEPEFQCGQDDDDFDRAPVIQPEREAQPARCFNMPRVSKDKAKDRWNAMNIEESSGTDCDSDFDMGQDDEDDQSPKDEWLQVEDEDLSGDEMFVGSPKPAVNSQSIWSSSKSTGSSARKMVRQQRTPVASSRATSFTELSSSRDTRIKQENIQESDAESVVILAPPEKKEVKGKGKARLIERVRGDEND